MDRLMDKDHLRNFDYGSEAPESLGWKVVRRQGLEPRTR
jgi:hypothetical protein